MTPEQRHEIIHRFHSGHSMRGIANDLHLSRHTVSQTLRQHTVDRREGPPSADQPVPPESRTSKLDAHDAKIQSLLERYPKITAKRILEEIQADGYDGGYSILSERIVRLRPRDGKPFTPRFETGPGVQAQMDYALYTLDFTSEGRRRVNLFSYILGYSRRQYLRFVESQDLAMTLREHVRAFEHLGGAAATCLYDNMKVVVDRWEDDQPIYNRRFLAFAMHYGFRPVACRPRRPQTKGKVERPFDYVEKSLLAGREFRSLEHLNEVTQWWLAEKADVRTHATTGERPIDRHAEERSSLLVLPESAYEVHEVIYRVVDAEGFVACEGNRYSVPWKKTHPGEVLAVKITDTEVIIYGRDYSEIARHGLFLRTARGAVREDPAHGPPRETRLRRDVLQARFAEFGDVAKQFLDGLWQAQRHAPSQAALILELSGLYRRPDFIAALERAVRFGAYSLASVRRILEINARPKSALESLLDSPGEPLTSLSDISSPPRATSAYQSLLFPEPDNETPTQDEKTVAEETSTPGVEITEGSAAITGPKDDESQAPTTACVPTKTQKPAKTLTPARLREEILSALFALRVPVSPEQLDAALQTAESRGNSHLAFLWELLGTAAADRQERTIARRIREAHFPNQGSLEDFDWSFNAAAIDRIQIEQLATGDWVERFENLVMLGQSGVGKSRLLEGIGRRLCVLGKRVRYTTSGDLITRLTASLADGTLPRQISYWTKFDLLIVDEFGLDYVERQLDPQAGHLLFKVIAARNGKSSTALGTNIEFDAWSEYLGDAPLAMALLDRVVDRAVLLNILGKSYRASRAKRSKAPRPSEPNT